MDNPTDALVAAANHLIHDLVRFHHRTQTFRCRVCDRRSGPLHREDCPVYRLHAAVDAVIAASDDEQE